MDTVRERLYARALELPGAHEGIACEGTPLERRTVRVGKKAFAFFGVGDLMVKLGPAEAAARGLAEQGGVVTIGAHGWATVRFQQGAPDEGTLAAWIEESWGLLAPKRLR